MCLLVLVLSSTAGCKPMNQLPFEGVEWSVLFSSRRVIEHGGEL